MRERLIAWLTSRGVISGDRDYTDDELIGALEAYEEWAASCLEDAKK